MRVVCVCVGMVSLCVHQVSRTQVLCAQSYTHTNLLVHTKNSGFELLFEFGSCEKIRDIFNMRESWRERHGHVRK